jgi:hypothetical protein
VSINLREAFLPALRRSFHLLATGRAPALPVKRVALRVHSA